jgi:hypothetical protein
VRLRGDSGFGLLLLVAMIAISGIIFAASTRVLENVTRQMQTRIDEEKARYLAQAGVMRAAYDWRISNATAINRTYDDLNVTVTGNNLFKTGAQANFAYFSFNSTENAIWTTIGGNMQLRQWRMKNIHVAEAGTADDLVTSRVRVSWENPNTGTLRRLSVNNGTTTTTVLAVGTYANGTDVAVSAAATLTPGQTWQGNNTFLEWNGAQTATRVSVQWTFSDESTTKDSKTHDVTYWNGAQSGAGRPTQHTFSVTSTGQVNQTGGTNIKTMKTLKATISGTPAAPEIIDTEDVSKHIP